MVKYLIEDLDDATNNKEFHDKNDPISGIQYEAIHDVHKRYKELKEQFSDHKLVVTASIPDYAHNTIINTIIDSNI